jgi:hypothetical protein
VHAIKAPEKVSSRPHNPRGQVLFIIVVDFYVENGFLIADKQ